MPSEGHQTPSEAYAQFLALMRAGSPTTFEDWVRGKKLLERELRDLHRAEETRTAGSSLYTPRASSRAAHADVLDDALRPGLGVAGYTLVSRIGRGGMGVVWEAHQASLDRRVAMKFIKPGRLGREVVERFRTEALAGGRINHPGIVTVLDTGSEGDRHWIAQELVEGGCTVHDTLEEMRALRTLPARYERHVAEFVAQVADALGAAHAAGVVHRDVKPLNILVTPDGRPKVGDFGLARLVDAGGPTRFGVEGTYHYMSPEQAAAKAIKVDHQSDVFSLGIVLYELLTLQRPFDGESAGQVLERIIHVDPPAPDAVRPRVPLDLATITLGALAKSKVDRYASMADLAADLRRFLSHEPIAYRPPGPLRRAQMWVLRHTTASVGLALGIALVIVLAFFGPELVRQRGRALAFEKQSRFVDGLRAIDRGDLAAAREHIDKALALDPKDPRGHVYLAAGFSEYARFGEAERELERARAKGFAPEDPRPDASAEDHLAYGLYLTTKEKSRGWAEAEAHLSRARELDPALDGVLFPLYQLRKALGDIAGAREALAAYSERLATGEPFYGVVQALLLELDGDRVGALERMHSLAGLDEERLQDLRYHRILARLHLELGQPVDAEIEARAHLAHMPEDGQASAYLARALIERYERESTAGGGRAQPLLDEAERAAVVAAAWDPNWAEGARLALDVALKRVGARPDPYAPLTDAELRPVRDSQRELAARDPGHEYLPRAEAQLAFLEALPESRRDRRAAVGLLQRCEELDPRHFLASALLGQWFWEPPVGPDYAAALAHLETAREAWDATDPYRRLWSRRWLLATHVWTFGTAAKLGQVERALRAREEALEELAHGAAEPGGHAGSTAELLTLAEFLATAEPAELRDCTRAHEIVDTYDLRTAFRGRRDAEAVLALIDASCP